MNPMIGKELRQRMRERRTWLLPSLYLIALAAVVAISYYATVEESRHSNLQGSSIGVTLFLTVSFAQMALLLLLAPVFSAGSLTIEKEQRTLGSLLTTLLTPAQIWWGKYVSSLLFLILLMVCALPVLSLAFAFGGIGPAEVAISTGVTLLVLGTVAAIGLYCSAFFRRSVHATAVTYAVVILLTAVTAILWALLQWYAENQTGSDPEPFYVKTPMLLNPFYLLIMAFERDPEKVPEWLLSGMLFLGIGLLAAGFGMRNIQRGGEQT